MYKIYADDSLIYDSTIDNFKIGKGVVTIETNKSGSFTFSIYPDHFYYDNFIRFKTVITVYKSDRIIFRGRILNDVTDYWNNKVITCEGELGFLQDSIIRPFSFTGTPEDLFKKFINEHNAQVDEFKRFKIGTVTVTDPNDYISRSNSNYEPSLSNISGRLLEDSLGGYIHITHGDDGTDPTPTINYLWDFTKVSSQEIKFGSNLKDYTKTVKAYDIATAIIPLGAEIDDEDDNTDNKRLTIVDVNNGRDYIYSEAGVALYGWIFKTVEWDDVTIASNLKSKAEQYLERMIEQNVTIELNAIDLHLLDKSIESISVGDYVRVTSAPHNFASTLLCQKQTIDLLKPDNDSITLGYTYSTFTENTVKRNTKIISNINSSVSGLSGKTNNLSNQMQGLSGKTDELFNQMQNFIDPKGNLPQILAKSFGLFQTVEVLSDGSSIYYLHNKSTLDGSTTIWKMTGDAFAVSTDGGATWNAGLDSNGNAVLNVLSTIGIKAEWIIADNLNAISANIGGWQIGASELYKTIRDSSDPNTIYKISFIPPTSATDETIVCKKSTDGGKTFLNTFTVWADGSVRFGVYRNTKMTQINEYGLRHYDASGNQIGALAMLSSEDKTQLEVDKIYVDDLYVKNSNNLTIDLHLVADGGDVVVLGFEQGLLRKFYYE